MTIYAGIMSGTSLDGLDIVLAQANPESWETLYLQSFDFPETLYQRLFDLARGRDDNLENMATADVEWAKFAGECCLQAIANANLSTDDIRAIGSHGQTIRHRPNNATPFTLQIGCPSTLAYVTNIDVVADFRRKDLAAGGQGAPLVPAFHASLFDHSDWALLNLGGIANISYSRQGAPSGFDIGPANTLMDQWVQRHFSQSFDRDALIARAHSIDNELLNRLLKDPYFKAANPKSTGPEYFNLDWLESALSPNINRGDVLTTLCELTARTCADQINLHAKDKQVYLCGGGALNPLLSERINALSLATISSSADLGINPQGMEALAFAWLAAQTINRKAGNSPSATGANNEVILGGIYQA